MTRNLATWHTLMVTAHRRIFLDFIEKRHVAAGS